jgi:N-acetylglucosamine malate deacetylase 1
MNLDALIFAAHPDDAELAMGGTIAKLSADGKKVGVIDLSKGELGTRGTPEIRQTEAFQSAVILKITCRENLDIKDGDMKKTKENLMKVIMAIRRHKPSIVFAPYKNDRHPDHVDASALIKEAFFSAGLTKLKTSDREKTQEAYRPKKLYYYMQSYTFDPSFIVDITDTFDLKMKGVKAFSSQFYDPKSKEPETFISSMNFMEFIEARARFYGFQIGKKYGEPFFSEEKIELDISGLLKK